VIDARRAARVALAIGVVAVAARCDHDRDETRPREADAATAYEVQRVALDSLFNGREHAQRLVLWATDAGNGPVLEALARVVLKSADPRTIDVAHLSSSLPARVMTETAVTELFRRNADGWAAFFRENAGAAGLVELSPVWLSPDGVHATTYIGRACGEHCRNAWWVSVRQTSGRWHIQELRWVRVPGV
jgi:hypothetical protein